MSVEIILFIVLLVTVFINQGVQMYIHFEAYPLFKYVGTAEFSVYTKEYEKRLTVPLLLPYALTVLSNIALIFVRPAPIPVIAIIVVLVLNLAIAGVSLGLATPVYTRITTAGKAEGADMAQLMRLNVLRLALSSAVSAAMIVLLALLLA